MGVFQSLQLALTATLLLTTASTSSAAGVKRACTFIQDGLPYTSTGSSRSIGARYTNLGSITEPLNFTQTVDWYTTFDTSVVSYDVLADGAFYPTYQSYTARVVGEFKMVPSFRSQTISPIWTAVMMCRDGRTEGCSTNGNGTVCFPYVRDTELVGSFNYVILG